MAASGYSRPLLQAKHALASTAMRQPLAGGRRLLVANLGGESPRGRASHRLGDRAWCWAERGIAAGRASHGLGRKKPGQGQGVQVKC